MPNILILGGGMIGSTMAIDLASDLGIRITVADVDQDRLIALTQRIEKLRQRTIATQTIDLSDASAVRRLANEADAVLGALPSILGFATLKVILEAGRNYVDISFMPENPLELDSLARQHGVTAVVDCGVAPGLSNMMAGAATTMFDPCESIEIYVGGLPRERNWPYEYKAAFAPYDVIEEYTRPSRLVERGSVVVRPALSEPELLDFSGCPGIGTLEAFNTDGLRTLIHTLDVPEMKEKTLRYPGHIELMRVLRETGYFSHEPVDVGGRSVRPIDLTSALLFPKWKYRENEADVTVMRVIAKGSMSKRRRVVQWDLFDVRDPNDGCSSMSRTTAFPATLVIRDLMAKNLKTPGVLPPERLGQIPGVLERYLVQLRERGVRIQHTETEE